MITAMLTKNMSARIYIILCVDSEYADIKIWYGCQNHFETCIKLCLYYYIKECQSVNVVNKFKGFCFRSQF
jgi:hypothetical protein